MKYERLIAEFTAMPLAIHRELLPPLVSLLAFRAAGGRLTEQEIDARISVGQERAAARGAGARVGAVAVLPILGLLLPRAEALSRTSGAVSVQAITAAFQALVNDDTVGAIVLDMDSGGGSVGGIEEFADAVHAARRRKPIVAIANPLMCSAAYWIGAAASELVVTPSALVGSIGVYTVHQDISQALTKAGVRTTLIGAGARKTLGSEFEPLSDDARAEIQGRVENFYRLFVAAVARGRGVSVASVRDGFGEGAAVTAQAAVARGMADRIGTLEETVARLGDPRRSAAFRSPSGGSSRGHSGPAEAHRHRLELADLDTPMSETLACRHERDRHRHRLLLAGLED